MTVNKDLVKSRQIKNNYKVFLSNKHQIKNSGKVKAKIRVSQITIEQPFMTLTNTTIAPNTY